MKKSPSGSRLLKGYTYSTIAINVVYTVIFKFLLNFDARIIVQSEENYFFVVLVIKCDE